MERKKFYFTVTIDNVLKPYLKKSYKRALGLPFSSFIKGRKYSSYPGGTAVAFKGSLVVDSYRAS